MFTDIPPKNAPLPESLLLKNGWNFSILMTALNIFFVFVCLWLIVTGKGMLAGIALLVFIPGIWMGIEHIRTGGYFLLLEHDQFTRGVFGVKHTWSWKEVSSFRADSFKGQKGVWARQENGDSGDDIFIENGSRDAEALAELLNRFRQRAIGQRFKV